MHGDSLGPENRRLEIAILGLAHRGHALRWLGRPPVEAAPDGVVTLVAGRPGRHAGEALVLGGGAAPARVSYAGWLALAHSMLLAVDAQRIRRWGMGGRAGWGSLDSWGIADSPPGAEAGIGEEFAARIAQWSGEPPPEHADATHPDTEILERLCERILAGHRGQSLRAAAFVDRDGTLVIERGYLSDAADIELLPGVPEALRELRAAGHTLVVVSNQSGVGRGLFPLSRVYEAMARLRTELRRHDVELDAVYFCPHRPDSGCACRKPGTELLRAAAKNLGIALGASAMLGDKLLDVATGHAAGALGILVETGYGRDEAGRLFDSELARPPDLVAKDLPAAAAWLIARNGG